jgi:hypothetical protein
VNTPHEEMVAADPASNTTMKVFRATHFALCILSLRSQ